MIDTLYVEEEIASHVRTQKILEKFPSARTISIDRFSEVFNRTSQNFRLQKQKPSLILAKKYGRCVHSLPAEHCLTTKKSFYFSIFYNCLFDCAYCYLQGFFRSAHLLFFVNFEEFFQQIDATIAQHPSEELLFFSGYESDSLGCEGIFPFLEEFLPFFQKRPQSFFEIRTKSASTSCLLQRAPIDNCIIAFSCTPSAIFQAFEKKVPPLIQRLEAMKALQEKGWKVALRLDPLVFFQGFEEEYGKLFSFIFSTIDAHLIHSVTLGTLRYPKEVYKNMRHLHISSELLAPLFEGENKMFGYTPDVKEILFTFCEKRLSFYLPKEKIFIQEKR